MARALFLSAMGAALVTVAWLDLEESPAAFVDVGRTLGLALAPALVLVLARRRLAAVGALVLAALAALSLSFDVSLTDMRPRSDRDFWGPVLGAMREGFRDIYEADAPFVRGDHPELAGLVLVAVFGVVAAFALCLVSRRPLAAGLLLLVGVGTPATISVASPGAAPLRTGALCLAALLVLLFLTREGERPLRSLVPAVGLGALVVLVAVAASTSGAVAKDAFVAWQRWDFYDRPRDPVGVRYVWASNYRGIAFPKKETVVLRIRAPKRALYWRATTLDVYTGVTWREDLEPGRPRRTGTLEDALDDPLVPEGARGDRGIVRQDVTVVALSDTHMIAAAHPARWQLDPTQPVQYAPGGVVFRPEGLVQGEQYTVWSYAPEVEPKELATLGPDYPDGIGEFLDVVPGVRFPAFGTRGRDGAVERIFAERSFDALLAGYEPLYRQARELAAGTDSPYLAAATLETWFRSAGGFRYDEQPAQPVGTDPPLVDFALRTKEGYCQHYAGAMAVMLRLLGVPARVAAGFTSGKYDSRRGEWVVTDRNAHTWVEVYFPRYGWLPFDPTPGRGELAASYSTASATFPTEGVNALGVAAADLTAILRERLAGIEPGPLGSDPRGVGAGSGAGTPGGGVSVAVIVIATLAGVLALVLAAKALRRELRFVGRDPRRAASACRRELAAFLADQGIAVPASATIQELGELVERRYRVNATPFVRAAGLARFGQPDGAADAARTARRELRSLERQIRRTLTVSRRARGALNLRSLAV